MTTTTHAARLRQHHPIEAELSALQESNRLAIHVWENYQEYEFPEFSWDALSKTPAAQLAKGIADRSTPLISMSLLPKQASGISMRPFDIHEGNVQLGAYLVDLSQDHKHPARVLRASMSGLVSGEHVMDKNFRMDTSSGIRALNEFYASFDHDEARLRAAIAGRSGAAHTRTQLDILGHFYDHIGQLSPSKRTHSIDFLDDGNTVADFNEILVAAAKPHIKAIAIPLMKNDERPHPWYLPAQRLVGAIAGLHHLKKGVDLPVVFYHVTPLDHQINHQGQCTYLAQGEAELITTALEACKELERQHIAGSAADSPTLRDVKTAIDFPHLCTATKALLNGLDLEHPLATQHRVQAELDARVQAATKQSRA